MRKNWAKAEECGRELLKAEYGYGLMDRYADIFTLENEGNKEIIFACTEERGTNLQLWHDHALPGNYPTQNTAIQKWDGYKVPWPFYRTFEEGDDRLSVLVGEYVGTDGVLFNEESDIAKHGNLYSGAVPVKYGEDPESTGDGSQIDLVVYRYADVLTLLSEAIVRKGNAVTSEALDQVLSQKWGEHYISLADVTAQPSSTYEAQQAMAEAILQKLQELNYISKTDEITEIQRLKE